MPLSAAKAARLAWQVRGRRPLAWWAARRLVRAGDRGDVHATDALWDLWLGQPSDELWTALSRWRRPRTGGGRSLVALGEPAAASVVVDAACQVGHPVADTARALILAGRQDLVDAVCAVVMSTEDDGLTRLCLEHHLAPADPRQGAVFFLLTGQGERYRLADPDHSLLALAYQAAGDSERSRIRAEVAGEPDLVRVLADAVRRDRMARVTGQEAGYLIDALATRRDWPALWALARDLPVMDAVKAAHRFHGWRPEGPDEPLFSTLIRVDRVQLARSHSAVAEPWTGPWTTLVSTGSDVADGSFAPDGRLAALCRRSVEVFAPPFRGEPQRVERPPALGQPAVLALDHGLVILAGMDEKGSGFITRGGHERYATRYRTSPVVAGLARTAAGFVALTSDRSGRLRLRLQPEDGRDFLIPAPLFLNLGTQLGMSALKVPLRWWTVATEPDSGRIAVAGDGLYVAELAGDRLRPLAAAPFGAGPGPRLAFSGPDRLIGLDHLRRLRVWRLAGNEVLVVAERQLEEVSGGNFPVDLPVAGMIAVIDRADDSARERVCYLDRETLADVPTPRRLADLFPMCLFASPDGATLAVGGQGFVEVGDPGCAPAVVALADRPLAATSPADLYAVTAQLSRIRPDAPARPFLELLRACLTHRFGVDFAIGEAGSVGVRGDDIALGGMA